MERLEGKTAMITGAGTGIGRACMMLFAKEGAEVFGVSRTQANLDETVKLLEAEGGTGSVFSADLSIPEGARASVKQMMDTYGRIDILLNAAGVGYSLKETSIGSMDPVDTTPIDKWREVMAGSIDRLGDLHERFEAVLDHMIERHARFGSYKTKLLAALEKHFISSG